MRTRWISRLLSIILITGSLILVPGARHAYAAFPGLSGRIVFVGVSSGGYENDIFSMNPDGTGRVRLTSKYYDRFPAVSPDGSRIAFVRPRNIGETPGSLDDELYVMNADGTGVIRLTDDHVSQSWPAWSPDGLRIAFWDLDYSGGGNSGIYTMKADGTDVQLVAAGGAEPAWSPDGTQIAYAFPDGSDWEIYRTAADGTGSPTPVTSDP